MFKCSLFILLFIISMGHAAEKSLDDFFKALKTVESGNGDGINKIGDNGKALGPLQIHKCCWQDSGVKFAYEKCGQLKESKEVAIGYWNRYCAKALKEKNWEVLARVWNGGPKGHERESTENYWRKVQTELYR